MMFGAAAPVLWPFDGTDALLAVSLGVCILAVLLVLPLGWVAIRRAFGLKAAGPLWPLLFFELLASFYAFMTPPWLMPDEPQHMYYAELVRRSGTAVPEQLASGHPPKSQEQIDAVLASYRDILGSARRSDMKRWLPDAGRDLAVNRLPGPSELFHPPLYYVLAGGLTGPFEDADVRGRLALLRAVGVMLTAWAIWLCGVAGRMLWPTRRRLAEAPLVLAAGIPTVAAFAGAVNNDALANLIGAMLLVLVVAAVTGWMRRRPWLWTAGLLTAILLGLLTKRTIAPLALAVPVALVLRHVLQLRRFLALVVITQLALGVAALGLPAKRVAQWDRNGQARDYRCAGGAIGSWSICIEPSRTDGVRQYSSLASFEAVAGRPVTIGYWVRGRADDQVRVIVGEGVDTKIHLAPVEPIWRFHRVEVVPSRESGQLPVGFAGASSGRLDIDGVVMVKGRFSERPPVYGDGGKQVVWDGRLADNLLVNGSAEDVVRSAPRWLPAPIQRIANGGIDQLTRLVALWPDTMDTLDIVWERLVQTFGMFWATVGWEVPPLLLPVGILLFLAVLVALGWIGATAQVLRPGQRFTATARRGLGALAVCLVVGIGAVVARGLPPDRYLVVSGRYLFASLVALAVVMAAGWRRFWPGDDRTFRNGVRWFALGTHTVFIVAMFFPFLSR